MLLVYEVESVVEDGEHGGTQRWQLTIIHLVSAKESCKFCMQGLAHVGKVFVCIWKEKAMRQKQDIVNKKLITKRARVNTHEYKRAMFE